jgi:hypothetical protein
MLVVNRDKHAFVKSRKHGDGAPSYPNWFIVQGVLAFGGGQQISYHVPNHMWENFKCKEVDIPPAYDGHTSDDVVKRLIDFATNYIG